MNDILFDYAEKSWETNIYGQMNDIVSYSNAEYTMKAYATKAGIRTEITLDKLPDQHTISFSISSTTLMLQKMSGGYNVLNDTKTDKGHQLQGIIRRPIVKDSFRGEEDNQNSHLFWNNTLSLVKEDDNRYKVEIHLDDRLKQTDTKFPITIDMSWEMHRGKQPDSVIYSGLRDTNQYLTDISIIGASGINGIGRNYSRLRIHEYIQDNPKNIKSAFYGTYEMTGLNSPTEIAAYKITDFWSSTGLTWNKK